MGSTLVADDTARSTFGLDGTLKIGALSIECVTAKIAKNPFLVTLWIFLAWALSAEASFITIATSVETKIEDNRATVRISVRNKGDEPAYNIRITARVMEEIVVSPLLDILKPGHPYNRDMGMDLIVEKAGRYPVIVTVDYTDASYYPFTALAVSFLDYKEKAVGRVFGRADPLEIARGGRVGVALKNLETAEKNIRVRLILPKDFSTPAPEMEVTVPVGKEKTVAFDIQNISALPGSRYPVYALLEYEDEQRHYTSEVEIRIDVIEDQGMPDAYKIALIAAVTILSGIVVYLNMNRRGKGRSPWY